MPTHPVVDLTSVSATAGGGVGRVAAGVVNGMHTLGAEPRCLVGAGRRAEWAPQLPGVQVEEVAVRLDANAGWQRAMRKVLPAGLRQSRAVGMVRNVRSHAVRSASQHQVVWYPFHRSVATSATSVVTVHDLRVFEPELASVMDQRVIERNVEHAAAIVCSWPHPYNSVRSMFPEAAGKTFQIPLPVLNSGHPKSGRTAPRANVTLLYPAFVTRHKNHETVIRAMAMMPGYRLICTGAETQYANEMRSLARALGLDDRIDWRGYVDQQQLDAAYEEADVLVMPTLWEAASGPVLEAVVRHLPFVASNIPPIADQVSALGLPVEEWLFVPRDPGRLADALTRCVAEYNDRAQALIEPALRVGRRSWEDTARDYLRVCAWANGDSALPTDLQG